MRSHPLANGGAVARSLIVGTDLAVVTSEPVNSGMSFVRDETEVAVAGPILLLVVPVIFSLPEAETGRGFITLREIFKSDMADGGAG